MTSGGRLEGLLGEGRLRTLFQPMFDIQTAEPRAVMLECLSRGPAGTNFESPVVLFEYARRKGQENELDRQALATALSTATEAPPSLDLSLNVHAATLERGPDFSHYFLDLAEEKGHAPDRLILEIVEHAPHFAGPAFLRRLETLRDAGVRVALDDVGLGQSSFRMILDSRPDYLKVDRYLVAGCAEDPGRQAVLYSLVALAEKLGVRIIAEGVSERADLSALTSLGVDYAQGFLLSEPLAVTELHRLEAA